MFFKLRIYTLENNPLLLYICYIIKNKIFEQGFNHEIPFLSLY
jgi:hypothetical protein